MRYVDLKGTDMKVSRLAIKVSQQANMEEIVRKAVELGVNTFDCTENENVLGDILKKYPKLRKKIYIQVNYQKNSFDLSQRQILDYVDEVLSKLNTEYLDILILDDSDILVDPLELALTFDILHASGKVKYFGVFEMDSTGIKLYRKHSKHPIVMNHLALSLNDKNLVNNKRNTMNYCYLHDITMQTYFHYSSSDILEEISQNYKITSKGMYFAGLLRFPSRIQVLANIEDIEELKELCDASDIKISREDFYKIYL